MTDRSHVLDVHFTLGPASWPEPVLHAILAAGVTACRINLSHTQPEQLAAWFAHVRRAAEVSGRALAIGADVRGRKLRIGPLPEGQITLTAGQRLTLVPVGVAEERLGNDGWVSVNCPTLGQIARAGDLVLLDDGALRLRVEETQADAVPCIVEVGGPLPERSGCNLPGRALRLPPLTPKDAADLDALATLHPDFVYFSYVEDASDIRALRAELARRGLHIPIIAKIERAVAVTNVAVIARAADGLCLARGDLGVEVSLPRLPAVQRQVAATTRALETPLLLAGEVLFSLVTRHTPFRAEATDVAVAVEQGWTGFILSDETAIGCDPPGAVRWLRAIAEEAERRSVDW